MDAYPTAITIAAICTVYAASWLIVKLRKDYLVKKAKRLGVTQAVKNTKPKPAANARYIYIRAQIGDGTRALLRNTRGMCLRRGKEINLLFTANDIKVAYDRANNNPEDIPKVSLLRDMPIKP